MPFKKKTLKKSIFCHYFWLLYREASFLLDYECLQRKKNILFFVYDLSQEEKEEGEFFSHPFI